MKHDHDFETYMRNVLDTGHSIRKEADAPPVDTWQRVLAQVQSKPEKRNEMSSNAIAATAAPYASVIPQHRRGFGHYMNLAATIALVLAVAVAGWFATMQLNQSGGSDGPFAILGQTDKAEICDVETMTVDEAMSIAMNPLAHLEPDEGFMEMEEYLLFGWIMDQEQSRPGYVSPFTMVSNVQLEPVSEDDFAESTAVAQAFLDCIVHGAIGQVWQFLDPVTLHYEIHSVFPMFTSEEDARVILADLLVSPADGVWDDGDVNPLQDSGSVQVNPNQELTYSVHQPPGGSIHIVDAVLAPLVFLDDDGNVLLETTVTGFPLEADGLRLSNALNVVVGRSMIDGTWYVIGFIHAESYSLLNP